MSETDWMALAIAAAHRAAPDSYPGPGVACVVVHNGLEVARTISKGAPTWGGEHAEVLALEELRKHGIDPAECDFYVNLEPCFERAFGEASCTHKLIEAHVRSVHLAIEDPYMRVRGRGLKLLQDAGIPVAVGEHAVGAYQANEQYFHRFCPNCGWVLKD